MSTDGADRVGQRGRGLAIAAVVAAVAPLWLPTTVALAFVAAGETSAPAFIPAGMVVAALPAAAVALALRGAARRRAGAAAAAPPNRTLRAAWIIAWLLTAGVVVLLLAFSMSGCLVPDNCP